MSDEFDDKTPMDSENEELNENQESASEEIDSENLIATRISPRMSKARKFSMLRT